ncbi:MAG: agmatinase [Candidatus Theseobacter exili]|nr:agmatinase [Candidatus Theseobacter exili]
MKKKESFINNPNFGQYPSPYCELKNSKIVIVPTPYEKTVTYQKGTEFGPRAIIEASEQLEFYDEEIGIETYKSGIHTNKFLKIESLSPGRAIDEIESNCRIICASGKLPVLIGGEHSVSIGAARALKSFHSDLSFLVFDAHSDLRNEYEGSEYNHACTSRRLSEIGKIVLLGVRSISSEELPVLNNDNVNVIFAKDLKDGLDFEMLDEYLTENVYVSIDLDVFDPSCMPSVGTPEPGGLYWYEVLDVLKKVAKEKNVVGFDVVELAPQEGCISSDFTAAKLIYRFIGYILSSQRREKNGATGST